MDGDIIKMKFNLMSNAAESNATVIWSLREELLLAYAVKRHGFNNWEKVAMELQIRTTNAFLFTAGFCKDKYLNLRKRFLSSHNHGGGAAAAVGGGDDNDGDDDGGGEGEEKEKEEFGWLEELRNLRVAELKMEVQRSDLFIESLKIKVKTMAEEGLNRDAKMADLDDGKGAERSDNDKINGQKATSAVVAGNSGSGEDVNRSFNESNSTDHTRTGLTNEPKPVEIKPPSNPTLKPVEVDSSCNDSSDSKEREKDRVNPAELVNSSSESRQGSHGTKGSSGDMQSSASQITRRNNKRIINKVGKGSGGGSGGVKVVPATAASKKGHGVGGGGGGGKLEPMFGVLDAIRSHKNGYVFQRRLEIQKSRKYNNIIRRHMDLEMIQTRIENGSYSSCPSKIYVDLLLLYNNAIVFFPKSSSQARVAHQLRQVVMNHLQKHSPPAPKLPPTPDPLSRSERSGSLLAKQKSTAPIVVCKKRSNISSKPSSSSAAIKTDKQAQKKPDSNTKPLVNKSTLSSSNEEDVATKSKANEKPVTGVRSARKGINVRPRLSPPPPQPSHNLSEKPESSKPENSKASKEKEKAVAEVNNNDKKKGAANFLKRIKKNEAPPPGQSSGGKKEQVIKKTDDVGGRSSGGGKRGKEDSSIKTSDEAAGQTTSTKRIGRPPKKGKEAIKGKRDRDGEEEGGGGSSSKRPIKRPRR